MVVTIPLLSSSSSGEVALVTVVASTSSSPVVVVQVVTCCCCVDVSQSIFLETFFRIFLVFGRGDEVNSESKSVVVFASKFSVDFWFTSSDSSSVVIGGRAVVEVVVVVDRRIFFRGTMELGLELDTAVNEDGDPAVESGEVGVAFSVAVRVDDADEDEAAEVASSSFAVLFRSFAFIDESSSPL